MNREITVVLKPTEPDKLTGSARVWHFINEFIKSPFFSFVFGASFATLLAHLQVLTIPEDMRKAQEKEQMAKADAVLETNGMVRPAPPTSPKRAR